MTQDRPDCIGEGSYYSLKQLESSCEGSLPTPDIGSRSDSRLKPLSSEIRIHPDTGEPYFLPAILCDMNNPDWYVRIRSAWTLGRTGDIEAIVPLVAALDDEHKEVRDRAQEALHAMETNGEPLPVRVLLCKTVDDATRTDMLLALTGARAARGTVYMYGSAKAYCEHLLEEDSARLDGEEQDVLASLKRSAAAVLSELSRRSDANTLLRAGDPHNGPHDNQLLRSSEPGLRPGEVENLLRSPCEGTSP